jgi:hypothetical protein
LKAAASASHENQSAPRSISAELQPKGGQVQKVLASMLVVLVGFVGLACGQAGVATTEQLRQMQERLDAALKQLSDTQAEVRSLATQLQQVQKQTSLPAPKSTTTVAESVEHATPTAVVPSGTSAPAAAEFEEKDPVARFQERIVDAGLNGDERGNKLSLKPELFVQARYSTFPDHHATVSNFASNFRVSRVEAHWSGRINERFGAGFEIQYHPANDGDATQLINDAFIQFYPSERVAFTAGQFNIPFGFDNSQSSAVRESPERAMFVGYFFPGHRDRGVLVQGNVGGVQYFAGILNGNRFWADNNRQVNYNFRLRKVFEGAHLAWGVSGQVGHQLLPPGVTGRNDQNLIGVDMQYAIRNFGLRAELVGGDMPSTLLSLAPVFAPGFRPGRHSAGGSATATYQLAARDNVYVRYDQFNNDPVTTLNVRAVNFGYFRDLGIPGRVGIDYQWKNRLSFNDDAINSRLQLTWAATF